MNINGIQNAQLNRAQVQAGPKGQGPNNEAPSGQAAAHSAMPAWADGAITPQSSGIPLSDRIGYFKQQLMKLLTHWPPLFPAGHPSRIDMIKKIRGFEEELAKEAEKRKEIKQFVAPERVSEDSSDEQLTVSLERLFAFREETVRSESRKTGTLEPGPGVFVDIKV